MLMDTDTENEVGKFIEQARKAQGMSKAGLARELKISGSAVSQWESGETKPTPFNLVRVGMALGVPPEHPVMATALRKVALEGDADSPLLLTSEATAPSGEVSRTQILVAPDIDYRQHAFPNLIRGNVFHDTMKVPHHASAVSARPLARDVVVYGIAVAGEDADFSFNGQEINRVNRPPGLADAVGIFAIYVSNDSMYPAWRENATAFVDRNRAPSIGDDVVIEMYPDVEGEAGKAYFKRLVRRTSTRYIVEQFNPPRQIEIPVNGVKGIYRVVPWEEALGI